MDGGRVHSKDPPTGIRPIHSQCRNYVSEGRYGGGRQEQHAVRFPVQVIADGGEATDERAVVEGLLEVALDGTGQPLVVGDQGQSAAGHGTSLDGPRRGPKPGQLRRGPAALDRSASGGERPDGERSVNFWKHRSRFGRLSRDSHFAAAPGQSANPRASPPRLADWFTTRKMMPAHVLRPSQGESASPPR